MNNIMEADAGAEECDEDYAEQFSSFVLGGSLARAWILVSVVLLYFLRPVVAKDRSIRCPKR